MARIKEKGKIEDVLVVREKVDPAWRKTTISYKTEELQLLPGEDTSLFPEPLRVTTHIREDVSQADLDGINRLKEGDFTPLDIFQGSGFTGKRGPLTNRYARSCSGLHATLD